MQWEFIKILILGNFFICSGADSPVICSGADSPVVCFIDGCVRGVSYKDYDAFLGIPFAKPPVNELRFKVKIVMTLTELISGQPTFFRTPFPSKNGMEL